jgi:hypothetical protein
MVFDEDQVKMHETPYCEHNGIIRKNLVKFFGWYYKGVSSEKKQLIIDEITNLNNEDRMMGQVLCLIRVIDHASN